jgi:hypothetical protein
VSEWRQPKGKNRLGLLIVLVVIAIVIGFIVYVMYQFTTYHGQDLAPIATVRPLGPLTLGHLPYLGFGILVRLRRPVLNDPFPGSVPATHVAQSVRVRARNGFRRLAIAVAEFSRHGPA